MIEEAHEDQSGWTVCEGVSDESGKSVDPESLPDDDNTRNPTTYKEVPVGRPVSNEQHRKLKEAAKKDKLPSGRKSQVDPST